MRVGALVRSRQRWWLSAGLVLIAAGAFLFLGRAAAPQYAAGDTPGWAEGLTARTPGSIPAPPPRPAASVPGQSVSGEGESDPAEDLEPAGAVPLTNPVDLTALRKALPDNLYWELGAPTDDPAILSRRREEEERMSALFGKVQSSTATEEEIRGYYDRRRRISEDYIAFASRVLEDHGNDLTEQDAGLYALSVRMHLAQLEEIPRKTAEALARSQAHAAQREEWRGSQPGD